MIKGRCAKQIVSATIVTEDGHVFYGQNDCENPQTVCPRDTAGCKSGEGYEMCKDICQQTGHAEINALTRAGDAANGATLFLQGHTYACDPCKEAAIAAGIKRIVIIPRHLPDYIPYDEWIPKDDLEVGEWYLCKARCNSFALWNGEKFDVPSCSFGTHYIEHEKHWDDGAPHGTVKPFKLIEE